MGCGFSIRRIQPKFNVTKIAELPKSIMKVSPRFREVGKNTNNAVGKSL